jgi:serine/threonine protein kinase
MAHARAAEAPKTVDHPAVIGRYRILGVLGQGGMGIVYRGQDPTSGLEVAIKTVRAPHESDIGGLRREIAALWRLRHPGIVRIVDEGLLRGCPWFSMELLQGNTLRRLNSELWLDVAARHDGSGSLVPARTRVDETTVSGPALALSASYHRGPQPRAIRPPAAAGRLREVLVLMRRLCRTLAYLHGHGYVHRDLKPTNVFLRPDGTPVLVDFGLVCRFPALRAREALEPAGVRVGTAHYMAPEQVRAELVDARADLYSLGCLLYEAVTGQRPFDARSSDEVAEQQLALDPTAPGQLVSDLPPAVESLIQELLVKDARERVIHAEDVAEQLARLVPDASAASRRRAPYFFRPAPAGRRAQLGELERAVYTGVHGQGAMLLVRGEPGMGKTFLLAQVVRQAALRDYRVITGRCLPSAGGSPAPEVGAPPLHALRSVLRTVADRCRRGGPAVSRRLLGPRAALLAQFEPSLRAFLLDDEALDGKLEAAADDATVIDALGATLVELATEQRLILALDDLQWADPLTLSFLCSLRPERLGRLPLLVVGAYRCDRDTALLPELRALVDRSGARTLSLAPLDEHAVGTLVADLLAMPEPPQSLVKLMERRSRGNPARVIESMRVAASDGLLTRRGGRWVVTQTPPPGFWLRRTQRPEEISPPAP